MEDIKFIHKNFIPFIKKINVLLLIYIADDIKLKTESYITNLIHLFFHIYFINILYYKNTKLSIKLCDKTFILYNELMISCKNLIQEDKKMLSSIPSMLDINNYIYENTIPNINIKQSKMNDYMFLYIHIFKNIYTYIFTDIIYRNTISTHKKHIYLNTILLKFNKSLCNYFISQHICLIYKMRDILFHIINYIFDFKNINIVTKIYIFNTYMTLLTKYTIHNYDICKNMIIRNLNTNSVLYELYNNDRNNIKNQEKQTIYTSIINV